MVKNTLTDLLIGLFSLQQLGILAELMKNTVVEKWTDADIR
jgi:hypothetical protein